jgi:hypothetical protein
MITAYRKKATVHPDGRIEIKTPFLKPGTRTEMIVLVENKPEKFQTQTKPSRSRGNECIKLLCKNPVSL